MRPPAVTSRTALCSAFMAKLFNMQSDYFDAECNA